MNCKGCVNLGHDKFTGRHYCIETCGECRIEKTSELSSPIVPDKECSGFVSEWK